MNAENKYTKKDFVPEGEVKWCAGCGDFSILNQTQKVLGEIGRSPDEYTFISGIGCSSRFPYYMDCYGYHTIHGRALAVATGTKLANPELQVWVAMGDGDGLSIGGNHFLHAVRRNLDMVVILMDNRIYGLTKGQFSPTTEKGKITKTSPYGSLEEPLDPVNLAIGAGCSFVARSVDRNPKHLAATLHRAAEHKGFSLVHVLQNCVIFNDGVFDPWVNKETKADTNLYLEDGKPMIFSNGDKAIVREGFSPKVVNTADVDASEILVHHENADDPGLKGFLANMSSRAPEFPMPFGVIHQKKGPSFDQLMTEQVADVTAKKGKGDLMSLLNSGDTWDVK